MDFTHRKNWSQDRAQHDGPHAHLIHPALPPTTHCSSARLPSEVEDVVVKVAVLGAGVAGLVNARVLHGLGLDVTVYDARPDVGGVWSGTRGYPGLRTQNDKASYVFSELPMAAEAPEHPRRSDVQAYLSSYVRAHDLGDGLRLGTTVLAASWSDEDGRWRLEVDGADGRRADHADWLIVANGICSTPHRPSLTGEEDFLRAGGRIADASALGDDAPFDGLQVVVAGAGKSGADTAVAALAGGAQTVTVVTRSIGWKLPHRIAGSSFQRLVNTRLGEHLLWAPWRTGAGRLLRRADRGLRTRIVRGLADRIRTAQRLDRRGLLPKAPFSSVTHLTTDGFFESIDAERITLHRGRVMDALGVDESGGAQVVLDDGTRLAADLLINAVGYEQDLSFFDERTRSRLVDRDGQLTLSRHTTPLTVPNLVFAGWANSFRSPLVSEIQALWIAAHLHGLVRPSRDRAPSLQTYQLTHERAARRRLPQFSSGISILDQDAWIAEAGLRLPRRIVLKELLVPVDARDYAGLHQQLQRRVTAARRR